MARIPYPDPTELSEETTEFLGRLPALNIFRMLAGADGLLPAFSRFGNHLLNRTELDPVLRELAILRVGVALGGGVRTAPARGRQQAARHERRR